MKRVMLTSLIVALLLSGCGSSNTSSPWEPDWTEIAPFLAAEPMDSYTFRESADTLGLGGVYYATWTNGDGRDFINADGESTYIFNSQIYVITQEFRSESEAETNLSKWMAREKQNYQVQEEFGIVVNDREYTFLHLQSGSETNPYGFGYAAFTVCGSNAVCVELVCSEYFTADAQAVLEQFLSGLHYSE